ncbi:MAG TPA: hypothetical protein VMT95_02080 [Candidatus Binatia bacterium]|nr:hypothetical protein [Candidatus Binatia bacterium]
MRTTPEPRGHIFTAAIGILGDGKAGARQLLEEALARKLVPPNTTYHYVYASLIEYIARQFGRGRKPPILQDAALMWRRTPGAYMWVYDTSKAMLRNSASFGSRPPEYTGAPQAMNASVHAGSIW